MKKNKISKHQKGIVNVLIITIIFLLIIGGLYVYINKQLANHSPVICTTDAKLCPDGSYVSRTGPNCEFTSCPQAEFNKSIVMNINNEIVFPDGLSLILKEINDSRCKPDVQCIWQGELSALFDVRINGSSEEIRLGTVNNKEVSLKGYTFSLEDATENNVTIIISMNSDSGISGYIHMGPTCPVQRDPIDPNCEDKPFANAKVDIMIKSSNILVNSIKSDANGNFSINLLPETYLIKVSSQTNSILPRCKQKEAIVTAKKFTSLDISCDTGIR